MGERLRFDFDYLDQAIKKLNETKEEFEAAQLGLRSQVNNLSGQFKGQSAQKFLGWWRDAGDKHWGSIVTSVQELYDKLDTIKFTVIGADERNAARFNDDVQIEQPGEQP